MVPRLVLVALWAMTATYSFPTASVVVSRWRRFPVTLEREAALRARATTVDTVDTFTPTSTSTSTSTGKVRRKRRNSSVDDDDQRFDQVARALAVYQKLHGTMNLPLKFVVPTANASWPEDLHGFNLGSAVRSIRYKGDLAAYHDRLESMGFPVDKEKHNFELFMKAFELYIQLNDGDTIVPRSFVVPREAPWPPEMHGMKLGMKVSSTRHGRAYFAPARVERLTALGFVWDPYAVAADTFLAAARAFKKKHGHMQIPKEYTVPEDDAYPKHMWGYVVVGSPAHILPLHATPCLSPPPPDMFYVLPPPPPPPLPPVGSNRA